MTSPDNPQQLAEEIERTRTQLGETVQALTAKADVKARARDKAKQLTSRAKGKADLARRQVSQQAQQVGEDRIPLAVFAGATGVAVVAALLLLRWRRQ